MEFTRWTGMQWGSMWCVKHMHTIRAHMHTIHGAYGRVKHMRTIRAPLCTQSMERHMACQAHAHDPRTHANDPRSSTRSEHDPWSSMWRALNTCIPSMHTCTHHHVDQDVVKCPNGVSAALHAEYVLQSDTHAHNPWNTPHQVDRNAVEPHMARLLHCMLLCFKDMAWPVRDAACVACGR